MHARVNFSPRVFTTAGFEWPACFFLANPNPRIISPSCESRRSFGCTTPCKHCHLCPHRLAQRTGSADNYDGHPCMLTAYQGWLHGAPHKIKRRSTKVAWAYVGAVKLPYQNASAGKCCMKGPTQGGNATNGWKAGKARKILARVISYHLKCGCTCVGIPLFRTLVRRPVYEVSP